MLKRDPSSLGSSSGAIMKIRTVMNVCMDAAVWCQLRPFEMRVAARSCAIASRWQQVPWPRKSCIMHRF